MKAQLRNGPPTKKSSASDAGVRSRNLPTMEKKTVLTGVTTNALMSANCSAGAKSSAAAPLSRCDSSWDAALSAPAWTAFMASGKRRSSEP